MKLNLKKIGGTLLGLVVSAGFILGAASPAQAAASSEFRNVATGFCLDNNTSGNVYTLGCNGSNFQRWDFAGSGTTTTLKNVSTQFCLDSNFAGNVYALGCNGGNFQKWQVFGSGGIVRNFATGRCLDSNTGGFVYTLGCNGGSFQKWLHA